MGVGGLCPKRASAQIRCKCTKKNGAGDVSTSFFETRLCTPSLHARFFPHYPGKSPIFSSKTRNHRTQLPNLRRPLRRWRVHPFDLPVVSGRGVHATVKTLSPARRIAHPWAIAPTSDGGEGFAPKVFTSIYMDHNILRHTGEGVKAKIEKRLMRAREKPSKK